MERDNGSWYARWRASAFQLTRSRGAWRAVVINHNVYNEFQLTRSRGAWLLRLHTPPVPLHFNSHAHVERDHKVEWFERTCEHFNSHAHVERDSFRVTVRLFRLFISTHTLTWSVTTFYTCLTSFSKFQLTRSRGAWHNEKRHCHSWLIFQLTRSRGAWLKHMDRFGLVSLFQLTRSRGAWRQG